MALALLSLTQYEEEIESIQVIQAGDSPLQLARHPHQTRLYDGQRQHGLRSMTLKVKWND
jgi:hypothetical protein